MRGSTSSTYWTPSTVTLTCAMSPSSSPRTTTDRQTPSTARAVIGARDNAPRPCGGEHIPTPIFASGNSARGAPGRDVLARQEGRAARRYLPTQMRIRIRRRSATAEERPVLIHSFGALLSEGAAGELT